MVRRALLTLLALLGAVMSGAAQERVKYGRPVPPDRSPPARMGPGRILERLGREDGRCVFAICGPDLRLCDPGEVPLAQVRVTLKLRRYPNDSESAMAGTAVSVSEMDNYR